MQNWRACTCSPSLSFPVCKEGRVELSLPLRRSQAKVGAEPQAAVTHMTQEKAKGHTVLGKLREGRRSLFWRGGEVQEGCLEEGPWELALRFLQGLTQYLRGSKGL